MEAAAECFIASTLIHPSSRAHLSPSAGWLGQALGLQLPSEFQFQTLLLKWNLTGERAEEPSGAQHTWERGELALPALPTLAKCFRCHSEALQSCNPHSAPGHFPDTFSWQMLPPLLPVHRKFLCSIPVAPADKLGAF